MYCYGNHISQISQPTQFRRAPPRKVLIFSSCTTLIVSIFQFVFFRFGAKKLGPSWKILNFNVRASGRKSKYTYFSKASAKVQQIFDMTKFFSKKNAKKMHFFHNSLKNQRISKYDFWEFFRVIGHFW